MDCPECGAFNSRLAEACADCGFPFVDQPEEPPPADPAPHAGLEQKAQALELLRTAYMVLLANHGLATSMMVRQGLDAVDQDLGLHVEFPRSFDREWSAEVGRNMTEAQHYLQRALAVLELKKIDADEANGKIVGVWESYLDGIFDFVALQQMRHNQRENKRLGRHVDALFEALRLSHADLERRFQPLPSFDLDTGETGLAKLSDKVGVVVGSPRMWSTSRWVVTVVLPLLGLLAVLAGLLFFD